MSLNPSKVIPKTKNITPGLPDATENVSGSFDWTGPQVCSEDCCLGQHSARKAVYIFF